MAAEITMPQLSDTMSEGTLVKWRKKEGDKVKEGEVIAEVETDKATMEMEAFESGTLAIVDVKEGDKVAVGGRLAVLATGAESIEDVRKQYAGAASKQQRAEKTSNKSDYAPQTDSASTHDAELGAEPIEQGRAQSRRELVHAGPAHTAEKLVAEAVAATQSRPSSDGGGNGHRIKVSPLARRIAEDKGIDLAQIRGSGPNGRIIQRDVMAVVEGGGQTHVEVAKAPATGEAASAAVATAARVARGQKETIPLTKMRSAIAAALQRSKSTVPHFYTTVDIDVEEIVKLRERMNRMLEAENVRLSVGDFVSKAVCVALARHPALNATFDGTQITRYGDVHLGMAVALQDGLIVPVLRSADQMGLKEIRQRSVDLAERARAQRLKREELSGATFTISNLGMFGVKEFSAIINPPEVAILAVAAAEKLPVVRDGQIVARAMMNVTLSCDHRAVDGATAADFLRTLKGIMEEPGLMLV